MFFESSRVSDLAWGWVGDAIYGGAILALRALGNRVGRFRPGIRQIFVGLAAALLLSGNILFFVFVKKWFLALSTTATIIFILFVWRELRSFWGLGFLGTDRQIQHGIDYGRSLRLVSNSLDFLGVGAAKLTREHQQFEAALQRCNRPTRAVRFLLCHPENYELEQIARSAGHGAETYRQNVVDSLRRIARFRRERKWNIEVRLYKRLPIFRLMFIDGWLCLASHYVFGEGEGGDLPQLHVSNRGQNIKRSLYYPFERYFEELWESSENWDLSSYLS